MMHRLTLRLLLAVSLALLRASSVYATSNHEYGPDEYVTISNGISPDGKLAITAHGSGELGYDGFHLYLTDVVTGKKIGVLEEIVDPLDTGADAFAAKWSSDSEQVTIVYRVDRHAPLKAVSYRVIARHARHTKGPFDVRDEDLMKYWQSYGSNAAPSPKIFGTPLKDE
jgi:hypothetical protein